MRKIFIVGNVTADPVQSTVNGRNVVNVNVAVDGRRKEDGADFFRLGIWSQQTADFVLKYIKKGEKVAVVGDLTFNTYVDRDGNKQVSYNIMVDTLDACGGGRRDGGAGAGGGGYANPGAAPGADSDLPF